MSSWRKFAEEVRQNERVGTIGTKGRKPPSSPTFVPIVPFVPKPVAIYPEVALRDWHDHLSRLDFHNTPAGLDRRDWWQKCEDSWWLYECFSSAAVRDGWSAADLFGVLPCRWGWGGLCDRLLGARNLKMDSDQAVWSARGQHECFCRGAGEDLLATGLEPIWVLSSI